MEEVASTPKLVDPTAITAEGALTATLPRADIEAALHDDVGADLFLEIARIQNGERNDRTVKVAWTRSELEDLLKQASGDQVTLTFDPAEVERMLDDPDFEAHGLRERALVITVAVATAAAGAGVAHGSVMIDGAGVSGSSSAITSIATDASTSGVPGAVSSIASDASTAGAATDASVPADGWMSGAQSIADAENAPADGWTSAVQSPAPDGGVSISTDASTSGQPGAVSGFVTDASTAGQPDSVSGFITDTGSEATRAPAPSAGGGSGFSVPDSAIEAALAGGMALLITGAAFVGRTQRRRESPA
jgi:hypothetical protein